MWRIPPVASSMLRAAVALALTAALAGCSSLASSLGSALATPTSPASKVATAAATAGQGAGAALRHIHDPKKVTYSLTLTSCRSRDGGQLPDPVCTPGAIDPAVTQADIGSTICRSGYTATVRPPAGETDHAKFDVAYAAYHVRHSVRSELDHLVSLELGGSNDIANLWPEVGKQPNAKDAVENALHRAVCDGKVSLAAAQQAVATDWITAEAKLGLN